MKNHPLHKSILLSLAVSCLMACSASALINIDSVYVGDIGNPNDITTGFGGVNYGYSLGKYEVTLNQYSTFLNAVGATDTYGLYNPNMSTVSQIAGISRSGVSGSYTYSVIGSGNRPVTYVSWFDSARFANWLHNGQPTGAQTAGTTETGAYTLNGALSGVGITRNVNWVYGLASENEWYKAAYYQPVALGGDSDDYWLYPTANNSIPNSRNGSTIDSNSANFYRDDGIANGFNGGYAVNNSTTVPTGNVLTDVGAFSAAASFYGTFDQGGNVMEWEDAIIGSARGYRGGAWNDNVDNQKSSIRNTPDPTSENGSLGFRIAIVPEPNVIGFTSLAALILFHRFRRSR